MITDTNKLLYAMLTIVFQAGCSAQQMLATGQAYQRDQCLRMLDKLRRDYCLGQISTGYEEYKRETNAISH